MCRTATAYGQGEGNGAGFSISQNYPLRVISGIGFTVSYGEEQDVYHTTFQDMELYIKVTYCHNGGPPVISFKEKNV